MCITLYLFFNVCFGFGSDGQAEALVVCLLKQRICLSLKLKNVFVRIDLQVLTLLIRQPLSFGIYKYQQSTGKLPFLCDMLVHLSTRQFSDAGTLCPESIRNHFLDTLPTLRNLMEEIQ